MFVRQAITTTYHGPTNSRGSRIVARAQAGRISVPYDHALDIADNHAAAAKAFAAKWGWTGQWAGGATHDGAYVWVNVQKGGTFRVKTRKAA